MPSLFNEPHPNPVFEAQLKDQIIAEFNRNHRPRASSWHFWLPLSLSFAALALFLTFSNQLKAPSSTTSLSELEQELTLLEQELAQDMELNQAIEFSNL